MSTEQEREAPRIPACAMACIQAYGDARADDDGTSAARLGEAITELRKWAAAVTPSAPVAQWQKRHPDHDDGTWQNTSEGDAKWWRDSGGEKWEIRALYTHPAPQAQAVPDGWKLVPLAPTQEMKAAAVKFANGSAVYKSVAAPVLEIEEGIYGEAYEAMLAAAPSAPERAIHGTVTLGDGRTSYAVSDDAIRRAPRAAAEQVAHRVAKMLEVEWAKQVR